MTWAREPGPISAAGREHLTAIALRALRAEYPGRVVEVRWVQDHALLDAHPTPRLDHDRGEDAA